ncbi:MAG: insulinase family protein [Acidobacteriia bacterium]|nr:insulinase family protein [Terriglobia bacterium]
MFKRYFTLLLMLAVLAFAVAAGAITQAQQNAQAPTKAAQAPTKAAQTPKGPRPEQFTYPPLNFKIPKAADFRTTLSNGLVVYISEDHEIPWFNGTLMVKTGPFLESKDKLGVDSFTSSVMRSGGSTTMSGDQITERMDFLGGSLGGGGGAGGRGGGRGGGGGGGDAKSLSIHMRYLDEGLKIWMDVLSSPAFPEDRLRREKDSAIPPIRNRNRDVGTVAGRVYEELIYGKDTPITAQRTEAGINGITRDDLVAWYNKYWGASNAILVVSGDFNKADMLKKLEATFGKWRKAEKAVVPVPKVQQASKAGVYMVQPEGASPNQGIIRMGHLGLKTDDPDYPAVDLMNYILGGGSFSSRITKVVRTDNGLAYSTSSSFGGGGGRGGGGGILYPGTFTASCQTKNSTVVFATQLMMDLIEGMRNGDVSEADLKMAKSARINAFPSQPIFQDIGAIAQAFASLEFNGRPADYYETYLAKYEKVTLADIKRVAQKYLRPSDMVIMVAGNIEECRAGADKLLPNQPTIDAMAAKFGGRTIDGLAKKYGDGTVHIVTLK